MALVRCTVCGPPKSGKSSLVKRIISHRFDNLPTRNAEFMGLPGDGRHVSLFTVPPTALGPKGGKGGPSEVLLELHDQLEPSANEALNEPTWYEVGGSTGRSAYVESTDDAHLLSPQSKLLAAASAAANDGSDDLNTEHWSKTIDPREAAGGSRHGGGDDTGAGRGGPQMRTGMPTHAQHPLMAHQFEARAAQSVKESFSNARGSESSLLTQPHGTHGWAIVFDMCSRQSFEAAKGMAHDLLERVGWDHKVKQQCPIAVVLVGNKYDLTHNGKRSAVSLDEVLDFCARHVRQGMLLPQLRRQKVDRAIYRLCDKIVSTRKAMEASLREAAGKDATNPDRSKEDGAPVDVADGHHEGKEDDQARDVGGILAGVSARQYKAMQKLKAEFDPMNLARGSGQSCTDLDVLIAVHACVEHSVASAIESPSASDIYEALLACPALGIKYVPVSCRTNYQIHVCERVLLRALKLLPTEERKAGGKRDSSRSARAVAGGGLLDGFQSVTSGVTSGVTAFLTNPAECLGLRKAEAKTAASPDKM